MTRGAAVQDKVRTGTRQVLMMIMAAKLGWTEPGAEQEQGRSKARGRQDQEQEQDRSRAGAG